MAMSRRGDVDLSSDSKIAFELAAGGVMKLFASKDSSDNLQISNAPVFLDGLKLGTSSDSTISVYKAAAAFTPTVTATGTAGTPAYTTQVGRWARIGDLVFASGTIVLSGWTGTPTTRVQLVLPAGLPASANVSNIIHQCVVTSISADIQAGSVQLVGELAANSRNIDLYEITDDSTLANHAPDTGASYHFSIVYLAA